MKRLVLKLVFQTNITYSKENGFGTADLKLPLRVFETIDISSTKGVEISYRH
jgi:hypothetical protein